MSVVALRTALIWQDEVMDDVVLERPAKITLGATGKSTFVVPDVGLPPDFAIVRPGNRGYLLTLGDKMRGTICIDGQERDVEEFVARGGEGGGGDGTFRATPISGRDWGVVDLDESGAYKLFFQFVPLEEAPQFLTPKVLAGGVAGLVLSMAAMMLFRWNSGASLADGALEGAGISILAALVAGGLRWLIIQDGESQASYAFSIILHLALLFSTYQLYDGTDEFSWPGPRGMTGRYLVSRNEVVPPEPPEKEKTVATAQQEAAQKSPTKKNLRTATMGEQGASGGKGETERARTPNAILDDKPAPPDAGVMRGANRAIVDNIVDRDLSQTLGRFAGLEGTVVKKGSIGYGPGAGTGVGGGTGTGTTRGSKGKGSGGGGNVEGDFVTNRGKIDTGKDRPGGECVGPNCKGAGPKEVKVAIAAGTGDFGGYTEDEINRVVKARAGVFRACYQKELNRSPGIGGKLVIKFKIGPEGTVLAAANAGGSTLKNAEVESCVKGNVMRLRFPAKNTTANVTYPFVFSQGV